VVLLMPSLVVMMALLMQIVVANITSTDRPQIARCSTLRGRSAGHPENQPGARSTGGRFQFTSRLRDISRRAQEARLLTLFALRPIKGARKVYSSGLLEAAQKKHPLKPPEGKRGRSSPRELRWRGDEEEADFFLWELPR
jgi:hypothetical protein